MVPVPGTTSKFRTQAAVRSSASSTGRRYGLRSSSRLSGYAKGTVSAHSSMKKSNGLMTLRSAISPTVMLRRVARFGKTKRPTKLPKASCCQLMKWSAGSTCSE
ncbi:Uncharacterised protein [Mycobacteroides abscessus subsp. abscessus]|nr:Uncharacterised protein [Mycobacteroides abscessus subsp. abscessus]